MRKGVRKMKMTERRVMKRGRRRELRLSNILIREQLSNTETSRYVDDLKLFPYHTFALLK